MDSTLRVKVADFGTGRITAKLNQFDEAQHQVLEDNQPSVDLTGRTLSKGVGSLLWMAPEVLRGARVKEGQAAALDVYSFAIVLWEIWGRARPWEEVPGQGIAFTSNFTELVNAGVRPRLPPSQEPQGYRELMEQCWSGRPSARPTMAAVVSTLNGLVVGGTAIDATRESVM